MANTGLPLLVIFLISILINFSTVFAITESFSILPENQKTFDVTLQANQKIFFQIFISGEDNENIRMKIVDRQSNYTYFNSIIRENAEDAEFGSPEFPAYKSEINNDDSNEKILTFIFDNSLSHPSSKKIDFTYTILTNSDTYFEQTGFWSKITLLGIIVFGIVLSVIIIAKMFKKVKNR